VIGEPVLGPGCPWSRQYSEQIVLVQAALGKGSPWSMQYLCQEVLGLGNNTPLVSQSMGLAVLSLGQGSACSRLYFCKGSHWTRQYLGEAVIEYLAQDVFYLGNIWTMQS